MDIGIVITAWDQSRVSVTESQTDTERETTGTLTLSSLYSVCIVVGEGAVKRR